MIIIVFVISCLFFFALGGCIWYSVGLNDREEIMINKYLAEKMIDKNKDRETIIVDCNAQYDRCEVVNHLRAEAEKARQHFKQIDLTNKILYKEKVELLNLIKKIEEYCLNCNLKADSTACEILEIMESKENV